MRSLGSLVEERVVLPAPAMGADVERRRADVAGNRRIAFERERTAHDGRGHAALLQKPRDAPEADPRAIFKHGLGGEVTPLEGADIGRASCRERVCQYV